MMPLVIINEGSGFYWAHSQFETYLEPKGELLSLSLEGSEQSYKLTFKDSNLLHHIRTYDDPEDHFVEAYGTKYEFYDYISTILYVLFQDDVFVEILGEATADDFVHLEMLQDLIINCEYSWQLHHNLQALQ